MTNMQHYFEDIDDLLDGFSDEMVRRVQRVAKWDGQIAELTRERRIIEQLVFDQSKPMQERLELGARLAELQKMIRDKTEKKLDLAEKSNRLVKVVGERLREKAYNCKLELEADNPGCTEAREKLYTAFVQGHDEIAAQAGPSNTQPRRRARFVSHISDDDAASVRSATPGPKDMAMPKPILKKRPGRPRNVARGGKQASGPSSGRSSMDPDFPKPSKAPKAPSKYMQKKNREKAAREEERTKQELAKNAVKVETELVTGTLDPFALNGETDPMDDGELGEEDEQELLELLAFDGLQSPPQGMMEALEVTESALYGMEMYPAHLRPQNQQTPRPEDVPSSSGGSRPPSNTRAASSSASFTATKRKPNAGAAAAATSSSSGDLAEKRKRNLLFGSIADTSFSGRPRKLTDRVAEMIISNREKEERQKQKKSEMDDWCICGGANATNSEMMVACENKNCPIEWFHFACVGLTASPKNEWYCPECRRPPTQKHVNKRANDHK